MYKTKIEDKIMWISSLLYGIEFFLFFACSENGFDFGAWVWLGFNLILLGIGAFYYFICYECMWLWFGYMIEVKLFWSLNGFDLHALFDAYSDYGYRKIVFRFDRVLVYGRLVGTGIFYCFIY